MLGRLVSRPVEWADEALRVLAIAIDLLKERQMDPDGDFSRGPVLELVVSAYEALNCAAIMATAARRREWQAEDAKDRAAAAE